MKRLVKKRELISMDLTPLIDVVFLLLVFFIVASEFKKNETILNLTLPGSKSTQKVVKEKDILIELSKNSLAFSGKKIDFKILHTKLSTLKKEKFVKVKIDKNVEYQRVIKLLDILNSQNLKNLQLITKIKK